MGARCLAPFVGSYLRLVRSARSELSNRVVVIGDVDMLAIDNRCRCWAARLGLDQGHRVVRPPNYLIAAVFRSEAATIGQY